MLQSTPGVILITITTHGSVPCNLSPSSTNVNTKKFIFKPENENTTLFYVNATDLGVRNFQSVKSSEEINHFLVDKLKMFETQKNKTFSFSGFIKNIKTTLKEKRKMTLTNLKKNNNSQAVSDFMNAFDKSYKIKKYTKGEKVINKAFICGNNEKTENFNINILNTTKNIDLIENMNIPLVDGKYQLFLHQIIRYLEKMKNITKILIIDFSCNAIYDNSTFQLINNPRLIRRTRRNETSHFEDNSSPKNTTKKRKRKQTKQIQNKKRLKHT